MSRKKSAVTPPASLALVGGTLANDVLHRLREDIISGVLKPSERLPFELLKEIYDASFSTLREALSRLASEGLVISERQRGFAVAPISRDDLLDLTEVRVLIERECVARAIACRDAEFRARILSIFHKLDRMERDPVGAPALGGEWEALHAAFHEALIAGCGSPTLLEIRRNLFERARRYRRLSAAVRTEPRAKSDEHRNLMEAVLTGDVALAQRLMDQHIRATAGNVLNDLPNELPGALVG